MPDLSQLMISRSQLFVVDRTGLATYAQYGLAELTSKADWDRKVGKPDLHFARFLQSCPG